jgi:hypothetical protein
VGSSSVVGGEGSCGSAAEDVEVDGEGQGEQALSDALDEPGDRLGEVLFEAHLAA